MRSTSKAIQHNRTGFSKHSNIGNQCPAAASQRRVFCLPPSPDTCAKTCQYKQQTHVGASLRIGQAQPLRKLREASIESLIGWCFVSWLLHVEDCLKKSCRFGGLGCVSMAGSYATREVVCVLYALHCYAVVKLEVTWNFMNIHELMMAVSLGAGQPHSVHMSST